MKYKKQCIRCLRYEENNRFLGQSTYKHLEDAHKYCGYCLCRLLGGYDCDNHKEVAKWMRDNPEIEKLIR